MTSMNAHKQDDDWESYFYWNPKYLMQNGLPK